MQRFFYLVILTLLFTFTAQSQEFITKQATEDGYTYEYVTNDPMNTRIYTLDNGLKVYLSDYDNEPRAHIYVAVNAGGKNDPADNTGLAHYLEHMMFKGNDQFGTMDYEKEVVYLDKIEDMFNEYAQLTDSLERKKQYAKIDSISNVAAQYAIPNEYDKMTSLIGAKGLNAYTNNDQTVYTIDIPSNELGRFLEIEGSRFRKIVNRLFHTELEAVYEEKNRSLDSDFRKVYYAMLENLFRNHQYGTQTVIGTIEHLKNPSITATKKYFDTYYRPNNVAICISGDIEYSETMRLIDQYFGDWEPNDNLPEWQIAEEAPITSPIKEEIYGPDAEFIFLGYRFHGRTSEDYPMVQLIDMILNNAEAGLIDLNLKQRQKVLNAGCSPYFLNDYGVHYFYGNAKQNQSLDEVKDLILEQIELVKKGEFEEWLLDAVITDFKKSKMKELESNRARAGGMVEAFNNKISWADYLQEINKMESITKEQIVDFAQQHYQNNYVAVYKYTGEDPNIQQVEKPEISKVTMNRNDRSEFHQMIAEKDIPKLQPVFIDYEKDITKSSYNGIEVLSRVNEENELFQLIYLLDIGNFADKKLGLAAGYLEFLGTDDLSAEEFKKELYKLGCNFGVSSSNERTYVVLSGLDENMEKATQLFESLLNNPNPDKEALDNLVDRIFKARSDQKKQKQNILNSGLVNYAKYGPENPFTHILSNQELKEIKAEELVSKIKGITRLPHRILYYGPRNSTELTTFLTEYHTIPDQFDPLPDMKEFKELETKPRVYWAHYDMVQTEVIFLHKSIKVNPDQTPIITMFNEYFGGGMNSIVFQEIRESQGLAYSVNARYNRASKKDKPNYLTSYIGTQANKQVEAMDALIEVLNHLPESEDAFNIGKEGILNKIESERITRMGVIWYYLNAQDLGVKNDLRKQVYNQVKDMTLEDVKTFHREYIANKDFVTVLIGSRDQLDLESLAKYGEVTELSLEEIFGYQDVEEMEVD